MNIFSASLMGQIYWSVHKKDPVTQDLKSLPSWFFINPLIYPQIKLHHKISADVICIKDGAAIVETNGMILGTTIDVKEIIGINDSDKSNITNYDAIPGYIEHFSASLRQFSKQVTIPIIFVHGSSTNLVKLPLLNFPQIEPSSKCFLQKYIWETSIIWDQLVNADENLLTKKIQVYEELLLDAIHAFKDKDYRRTLLYAAISIETIAATKLDETYKEIVQKGDNKIALRIVSFVPRGGTKVIKDPVYKFLFNKSRFAERLHEVPLYLMGRSILLENEPLYQKAIKLYKTRNDIAHLGESMVGEQSQYETNEKDALEAIECAIEIFKWFGERANFPLPKFAMVEGKSPIRDQ